MGLSMKKVIKYKNQTSKSLVFAVKYFMGHQGLEPWTP